jgi:predicted TIM-barrel fold metal-dependent hydrolase
VEFFGSEKVVFGTDHPFDPNQSRTWMRETVQSVD